MKRWFSDRRKYLDADKIAERDATEKALKTIMDARDEEGYIELLKTMSPGMTAEELKRRILLFREHLS